MTAVLDPIRRTNAHRYACVYGATVTVDGHHGLSRRRHENRNKSVTLNRTDSQRKVQRPPETGPRTLALLSVSSTVINVINVNKARHSNL
jgi:hypothetical protein